MRMDKRRDGLSGNARFLAQHVDHLVGHGEAEHAPPLLARDCGHAPDEGRLASTSNTLDHNEPVGTG